MINGPSRIPNAEQLQDSPFLPTRPDKPLTCPDNRGGFLQILDHTLTPVERDAWEYKDIRRRSLARGEVPPQAPAGFHEVEGFILQLEKDFRKECSLI
jgi:hypothetical protein